MQTTTSAVTRCVCGAAHWRLATIVHRDAADQRMLARWCAAVGARGPDHPAPDWSTTRFVVRTGAKVVAS